MCCSRDESCSLSTEFLISEHDWRESWMQFDSFASPSTLPLLYGEDEVADAEFRRIDSKCACRCISIRGGKTRQNGVASGAAGELVVRFASERCWSGTAEGKAAATLLVDPFYVAWLLKCRAEADGRQELDGHLLNCFVRWPQASFKLKPTTAMSLCPIDYGWNRRVTRILRKGLELESLMFTLSTFGGACSAMGEYQQKFAEHAGRISAGQLALALALGDEVLVARCRLYFALSLVQTGRLSQAAKIIRRQYKEAKASNNLLLLNCSLGVWSRLKLEVQRRLGAQFD